MQPVRHANEPVLHIKDVAPGGLWLRDLSCWFWDGRIDSKLGDVGKTRINHPIFWWLIQPIYGDLGDGLLLFNHITQVWHKEGSQSQVITAPVAAVLNTIVDYQTQPAECTAAVTLW